MQNFVGIGRRGFALALPRIDIVPVEAAVLVVKIAAVVGVVDHRKGRPADRQEIEKRHPVGAVGLLQRGGVQRGADGVQLGQQRVALLGAPPAADGRFGRVGAAQRAVDGAVVIVQLQRPAVGFGLFVQPLHGGGQVLACLGLGILGPDTTAGGIV